MPPNPDNIESEIVTESGVHILFYSNNAMFIGRDRDDPETGVWLNNIDKQELHGALEEHNEFGARPGHVEVGDCGE